MKKSLFRIVLFAGLVAGVYQPDVLSCPWGFSTGLGKGDRCLYDCQCSSGNCKFKKIFDKRCE